MGRKKMSTEEKRKTFSLYVPIELFEKLEQLQIKNKSKFFDQLVREYFKTTSNN